MLLRHQLLLKNWIFEWTYLNEPETRYRERWPQDIIFLCLIMTFGFVLVFSWLKVWLLVFLLEYRCIVCFIRQQKSLKMGWSFWSETSRNEKNIMDLLKNENILVNFSFIRSPVVLTVKQEHMYLLRYSVGHL